MHADFGRYLRLLGFNSRPYGLDGLRQLVRAHILRVPFENVSKFLLFEREGAGRLTTLPEFLDGLEHHDLGGTCYINNPFLHLLLRELGYDADLLGADMSKPNVHTAIRVRLDGISFHVDCGYGAPFVEPIPLDSLPHEIQLGALRWVFDRAPDGRLQLTTYSRSGLDHGYRVNDTPRDHAFFGEIVADSFQPASTFMQMLRIIRIFPDRMMELKSRAFTTHRGQSSTEVTLQSYSELTHAIETDFQMPRCPTSRALSTLERINCVQLFP
jgi:arylamine N-acetyltransferase